MSTAPPPAGATPAGATPAEAPSAEAPAAGALSAGAPLPGAPLPGAPLPGLALGRPSRRRVAVPLGLVLAVLAVALLAVLHDQVSYYRVVSGSMRPTVPIGTRLAVEPGAALRAGEIVALHGPAGAVPATPQCGVPDEGEGFQQPCGVATPQMSPQIFVKRIIAGPGQLVALVNGHAVVDGVRLPEPYAVPCPGASACDFPTPVRVPADSYFVLGDDRPISDDSRYWGPVPASWIVGVVVHCHALQTDCRPVG